MQLDNDGMKMKEKNKCKNEKKCLTEWIVKINLWNKNT